MSEQADSRNVSLVLAGALVALRWIVYGLSLVAWSVALAVLYILQFLYRPIAFALMPVFYLGHFLLSCAMLPVRVVVAFEDFFIFVGVAALIGIVGGLGVRTIFGWLRVLLRLDVEPLPLGRSVKQYREDRRKSKERSDAQLLAAGYLSPGPLSSGTLSLSDSTGTRKGRRHRGLLAQTIMEEEDSDF